MLPVILLVVGFVLLIGGAEALVRGATRISLAAGLSRLVVGLVIVSLGTSAPEVAISTGSALQGKADLAIGNVLGSNVFNVLFILGITALVAPLIVSVRLIRLDIPIMVAIGVILAALALDGHLDLLDSIILLTLAVGYILMNLKLGRAEGLGETIPDTLITAQQSRGKTFVIAGGYILVGLAGLILGAQLVVNGASEIARLLGASDLVIGLTIVAIGTGLPEAATSLLAAIRGERDIAIGNIVGSNIMNITLVLGVSAFVSADGLAVARGALTFDLPVMLAVFIALVPVVFTGQCIVRWEGGVFLAYYVAYITFLFLSATVHPEAEKVGMAMLLFAGPLTAIVLGAAVWQELRQRKERSGST